VSIQPIYGSGSKEDLEMSPLRTRKKKKKNMVNTFSTRGLKKTI
jgi:hypothetical protein